MRPSYNFTAASEDVLWQQVAADLRQDPAEYSAELVQAGQPIHLDIDVDFGSGFEGGSALTSFTAPVPGSLALRFSLQEQDWVHVLGKLLGLTDVELGDAALDAAFIINTNDAQALRRLLLDTPGVRPTLLRYRACRLRLAPATDAADAPLQLVFTQEDALIEPGQLREVHHMLYALQQQLVAQSAA